VAPPARLERTTFGLGKGLQPEELREVGTPSVALPVALSGATYLPHPEEIRDLVSRLQLLLGQPPAKPERPQVYDRLLAGAPRTRFTRVLEDEDD